ADRRGEADEVSGRTGDQDRISSRIPGGLCGPLRPLRESLNSLAQSSQRTAKLARTLREATIVRVKLLPSSAGRSSQFQSLTSFTIDDRLAIDAGSIGFALAPHEIGSIHDFIITHAHTDHTASLPIYVAEAFPVLETPVIVYGTADVVSVLREFVFNDRVWPNFEAIQLNNGAGPALEFRELQPRETVNIAGFDVTPIPVNHLVPTVGLLVASETAARSEE